jgi:hypothetical protein
MGWKHLDFFDKSKILNKLINKLIIYFELFIQIFTSKFNFSLCNKSLI